MSTRYSFDPAKNAANIRKHGVSLAEADGVLSDPLAITIEDDAVEGEGRWVTIGTNIFGTCLVVVWTGPEEGTRDLGPQARSEGATHL